MPSFSQWLLVLPLIGLVLLAIGAARVWRLDRLTAIFMLLVWPIGAYALAKYWDEKTHNPRQPLLASLAAFLLWACVHGLMALFAPTHGGGEVVDWGQYQNDENSAAAIAARKRRAQVIANLPRRSGLVSLPNLPIALQVPTHFRFIDRAALLEAFAGTSDAPADSTVGWFVHERVDLNAARAWHVQVDYLGDGYVASSGFAEASGDALIARAREVARQLASAGGGASSEPVGFAELPTFDSRAARANWVIARTQPDSEVQTLDCHAVQLGRRGLVSFSMRAVEPRRQELCLRSVRLLSTHAFFGPGQTYAERARTLDRDAPYTLIDLITGAYRLAH